MKKEIPKLIAIGTQKAGSSFLYNLLKSHPNVCLSKKSEVNFYNSQNEEEDLDWYLNTYKRCENKIDISPKYFIQGKQIAHKIKEVLELEDAKPKFLLILRNPIDYINSHFQMQIQQNYFKDNPKYPNFSEHLPTFLERYPNYLERGRYFNILDKYWFPNFEFNKENYKIILFEEFIKNKDKHLKDILVFWEIPNPEIKLETNEISQNRALRSSLLHKAKNFIINNNSLKEKLKSSKIFNSFYKNILTTSSNSKKILPETDREEIKEYFTEDINSLNNLLPELNIKNIWKDFS